MSSSGGGIDLYNGLKPNAHRSISCFTPPQDSIARLVAVLVVFRKEVLCSIMIEPIWL